MAIPTARSVIWLETLIQDVRYGGRQLSRSPVLVAVAVLSLALGIGANTAIFTLINAVMLQTLPVRDPGQLVLFSDEISTGVYTGDSFPGDIFSYPSWQSLMTQQDSIEDLCAFREGTDDVILHVSGSGQSEAPERAEAHLVSGNYFRVFGVGAEYGRTLQEFDEMPGAAPAGVISYRFWERRFHRDEAVIGRTLVLNGSSITVVGVAQREFFGERVQAPPDIWLPLSLQPQVLHEADWLSARNVFWLNMLGRLKEGVSLESASTATTAHLRRFYSEQAGNSPSEATRRKLREVRVNLKPGGSGISGLRYRYSQPLHLLMAVVGVVLLIACANLSTLLLARASMRTREFSSRLALGASRSRLVRQVLTESILLSAIGGLAGVIVAWGSVKGLIVLFSVDRVVRVRPDPTVLAFTFAISIFTGILFGIMPAFRLSKTELGLGGLARTPRSAGAKFGGAQTLIVMQVALCFVLLLGAGLLARSLAALELQDVGFARDVMVARTDPQLGGFTKEQLPSLYRVLDERLNQIPGVESASIARYTPLSGQSTSGSFSIQGFAAPPGISMSIFWVEVGPRFFDTLRIPLLAGRTIDARDTATSLPVAVVNQTFVATYFPKQQVLGQRFSFDIPFRGSGFEIVGVVGDSRYHDDLRQAAKPMAYLAAWQLRGDSVYAGNLLLRTSGPSETIVPQVRRVVNEINKNLPILEVTTLNQQIDRSLYQHKLLTILCGVFGMAALLLASIGIYGTVAYAVARRTAEIGIRMAVGAQRRSVLWMVLRESIVLTLLGLVIGTPLALAGIRWIRSFLYETPVADPIAIPAAVLLIAIGSFIAAFMPARKATDLDPMVALRHE